MTLQAESRNSQVWLKIALIFIVLLVIPAAFGLYSIHLGEDTNWDLRNYHFYNGYAFLENRLNYDIAPAQQQTYFNPIFDVPLYLLYTHLPGKAVGFLYGFIHGFNISLLLLIFIQVSRIQSLALKILLGGVVAGISSIAPGFLSELGGSMNDNLVSLFTLTALLLLMISSKSRNGNPKEIRFWLVGMAGFIMGVATAGKLTASLFALSMGLLLPILFASAKQRWAALGIFILGGILGFALGDGFWLATLWKDFGNPLFPNYNNIFHSPLASSNAFLDKRFLPKNLAEYLLWPFIISRDSLRVSELKFSDIRFGILYGALLLWLFVAAVKQLFHPSRQSHVPADRLLFDGREGIFLTAFFSLSFALWMIQFSIYRYIVVLELLAPLCLLIILDRIFPFKVLVPASFIIALIFAGNAYTPYNWGRIPWSGRYIQLDQSQVGSITKANVIMLGSSPMSYVIPFFPKEVRFLRPESSFLRDYQSGMNKEIYKIIHQSNEPIYLLFDKNDSSLNLERSASFLELDFSQIKCQTLKDNMPDDIVLCSGVR